MSEINTFGLDLAKNVFTPPAPLRSRRMGLLICTQN